MQDAQLIHASGVTTSTDDDQSTVMGTTPATNGSSSQGTTSQGVLKNLNSQSYSTSLVLSSSLKQLVYMYLSQLMSTFTNYLKVHRSLDGYFIL